MLRVLVAISSSNAAEAPVAVAIALALFLILSLFWGRSTYDAFTIEQLIFQLKVNQKGLDASIIYSFISCK